jgi:hypothetical protein
MPTLGLVCIRGVPVSNRIAIGGPQMAGSGPSAPFQCDCAMVEGGPSKGDAIYPAWGEATSPSRV